MKIDAKIIEAELQELAGHAKIRVRLDTRNKVASSVRETDQRYTYDIKLNPTRIRSPKQLDEHLNYCRERVTR